MVLAQQSSNVAKRKRTDHRSCSGQGGCLALAGATVACMISKRRPSAIAAAFLISFAFVLAALYGVGVPDLERGLGRWRWPPPGSLSFIREPSGGEPRDGATSSSAQTADEEKPYNDSRSAEAEQKLRQRRISQICTRHSDLWQNERSWQYKVDQRHGIIFCPIPKAAWSSWRQVMLYAGGVSNITAVDADLQSDSDAGVRDTALPGVIHLKKSKPNSLPFFTFAFVRDPWRRLISAYISKALDSNYTRITHTPCSWEAMDPYGDSITFAQFLKCIIEHKDSPITMDMHWSPMSLLCDFCRLRYDFIGHMETVAADAAYVLSKLNISTTFPRVLPSRAYRTDEMVRKWYKTVPRYIVDELRSIYKFDFLLHGYRDVPPGWEDQLATPSKRKLR